MKKENQRKRKGQAGFTLIEIMVVVMIIAMLSTIVGVNVINRLEKAKRGGAAAQIRSLMTALDNFRLDCGYYPTTDQGLEALISPPSGGRQCKNYQQGGYLTGGIPLDPWGSPYVYFSPGLGGEDYTIESYGADGQDEGDGDNADIESWRLGEEQ
jgi:general secretion pathway protein G